MTETLQADVTELHPYAKLFGQAGMADNPGVWLNDAIESLVKTIRAETTSRVTSEIGERITSLRREYDMFREETRTICSEYSDDGSLCQPEAEKIAERLGLEPWWKKRYSVTIPVNITFTVESPDEMDSSDFVDMVDLRLNISGDGDVDVEDDTYEIDYTEIDYREME